MNQFTTISRRDFTNTAIATGTVATAAYTAQAVPQKKKPNILVIQTDQQSSWTLIVSHVKKPAWERLLTEKISDETAPDGWKTFEIDFPKQGWMVLQITSYYNEEDKAPAYWSKIDFVEVEE